MPLTFDPKGRFKKPNKNNPASKIRQPGEINDGLKSAARDQGSQGAKSTQQGKANYSGEMNPLKGDRPFDPPDAYSKEVQRAGSALTEGLNKNKGLLDAASGMTQLKAVGNYIGDVYNKGFFNASGRAASDIGDTYNKAVQGGADLIGLGAEAVGEAGSAFGAGYGGKDYVPTQAPDDDFTAYDDEFGGLPGAFNRDVASPEGSPEAAGGVASAPGVSKQFYDRADGTQGTLYSNTIQPDEPVGADGYTASGQFKGVDIGQSDYDRNTAGLSEINQGISDLLTNPAQVAANDRGLDDLLAYNDRKKLGKQAKSERRSLRTMLKRGKISGRRYTDAMAKIGAMEQDSVDSGIDTRELGIRDRMVQNEQARAAALNKQAGSKANATRYAADVGRQNELDKISATSQDTLTEGAFGQAEAETGLLKELLGTAEGIEFIKTQPALMARLSGQKQDPRAAYEALKKGR